MNLPNLISLSRVPFLFFIVALLYLPWPGCNSLAFALFVVGALTDWLDGFIARKYNKVSDFGKLIDALTDKIMIVGLFVSLLALDILPKWTIFFVLLIIGREFLITGLRLVAASKGLVLAAEKTGKQKTLTQIFSLGVLILWHTLHLDFGRWIPSPILHGTFYLGLVVFIIATYLTVQSGVAYMVKYWNIFTEQDYK